MRFKAGTLENTKRDSQFYYTKTYVHGRSTATHKTISNIFISNERQVFTKGKSCNARAPHHHIHASNLRNLSEKQLLHDLSRTIPGQRHCVAFHEVAPLSADQALGRLGVHQAVAKLQRAADRALE